MHTRQSFKGQTTDATAAQLWAIDLPADGAVTLEISALAVNTANHKALRMELDVVVSRNGGTLSVASGGNLTVPADGGHAQGFEPPGLGPAVSGSSFAVTVQGIAATTIEWAGEVHVITQIGSAPEGT
jgi:hypothetical protein